MRYLLIEGTLLANVGWRFLQASPPMRAFSVRLAVAMVPLVFFNIVLDMMGAPMAEVLGEIASMTLLMVYVHWASRQASCWGLR